MAEGLSSADVVRQEGVIWSVSLFVKFVMYPDAAAVFGHSM